MELEEHKKMLIKNVECLRDKWHRVDMGHNKMIENIKKAQALEELQAIETIYSTWLDA